MKKHSPGGEGEIKEGGNDGIEMIPGLGQGPDSEDLCYTYLASGSRDRTVRLWDALLGTCEESLLSAS